LPDYCYLFLVGVTPAMSWFVDDNDDDDSWVDEMIEKSEEREQRRESYLNKIWDDTLSKYFATAATEKWKPLWCKSVYTWWNGTKNLLTCVESIENKYQALQGISAYNALYKEQQKQKH